MTPSPSPLTPSIEQIKDALVNIGKLSTAILDVLPTLVSSITATTDSDTSSSVDTTYDGDISSKESEDTVVADICHCAAHTPHVGQNLYYTKTLKKEKIIACSGYEEVDCRVCGKTVQLRNLEEHMNTHLMYKERPYQCVLCAKCYAYKKDLVRHMRTHHNVRIC